MPIAAQYRYLYSTPEWKQKRQAALDRADNKCSRCKVPNGATVERRMVRSSGVCRAWWRRVAKKTWYDEKGKRAIAPEPFTRTWTLLITLTVAHLDHNPENMSDDNLEALCCRCHLMHDREHHAINAKRTRQIRKDSRRPLFIALMSNTVEAQR